jgi:glutathione S-transferase
VVASFAMKLVLHGNSTWSSPYVLSCFVTLREKGLPFEVKNIALNAGAHFDPAYAAMSLTARVPVLVDTASDLTLSESSAIIEYLEDRHPGPESPRVLPHDVRARARARQVMSWLRSDLMPLREERSSEYVFYEHDALPPFQPLSAAGQRAASKLLGAADRLIAEDSGPLFGAWCIADTDLAMMLQRLVKTNHDVAKKIRDYAERQWERPAVVEYRAHPRPEFQPSLMG